MTQSLQAMECNMLPSNPWITLQQRLQVPASHGSAWLLRCDDTAGACINAVSFMLSTGCSDLTTITCNKFWQKQLKLLLSASWGKQYQQANPDRKCLNLGFKLRLGSQDIIFVKKGGMGACLT